MAATHTIAAQKIGIKIDSLTKQMKEEPDGRLRAGLQKMIGELKHILKIELPKDQQKQAEIKKADDIKKAKTSTDLLNIAGDHNDSIENIMVTKMGGNIPVTKAAYGTNIPRHGLFGNIGNTASNATQNPTGTITGGGVGTGLGSVVGGTLGTLVGGPIGTTLGASIGGTIGTGVGASYGANGQFPWQNNDNTMAPEGSPQQNLPPPPPFAPPMNGPGAGYKPVHDAYYANGGEIPRYNYGSALAGMGQAAGYGNMAGGLFGLPENEFNTNELYEKGKGIGSMFTGPWGAIGQFGGNTLGLPELFDPLGSKLGFLQKDPETGERDWAGFAASLLGGPVGGFMYNQQNNPEKRGGVAGLLSGNRKEYGGNLSRHQYGHNLPEKEVVDGLPPEIINPTGTPQVTGPGFNPTFPAFNPNYSNFIMPTNTVVEPPNDNGWAGASDWANEFPWLQAGGVANDYVTDKQIQAPLRENARQLQDPRGYIWNPFYNSEETNMINMENDMRSNYDEMYDLAREEEYYSPSRALDENRFNTDRANKASEDLVGVEGLLYKDRNNNAGMDRATDIVGDYTELNRQANSPGAQLAKIQSTAPYLDALYGKTAGRGAARTMADMQAFDWNSKVDANTQNIRNELAQGTATYAQGNRNNQYMGDALSMGGAYWGFQPGVGMTWKQGGQGQGADPYGMTYEDFQEWQEWQNSQEEST